MSQYIASLVNNSYLPPFGNNEGQNAPKLKTFLPQNRWNTEKEIDWEYVKQVWTELLEESGKSVFIEASPPNMVQVKEIFECFSPKNFLFSISSPYSFVGSTLFNYEKNKSTKNRINKACQRWIRFAKLQMANINKYGYSKEITTYEKFCANPDSLIDIIFKTQEEKNFYINKLSNKKIMGKNNDKLTDIVNMQPKHLAFLGIKIINYISKQIAPHQEVLDFFNYKILTIADVNDIINENLIIALDGIERRTINPLSKKEAKLL